MAEFTKLIAMQKNLGLGHKGDIWLTTQERVNANQEPIAKDIIDEEHAKKLVRRWNSHDDLLAACKAVKSIKNKIYGFDVGKVIKKIEAAIAQAEKS